MRKKEQWMFIGALVLAGEKKGTITAMQENHLNGIDYVYYISVRLEGKKHAGQYHPDDIAELLPAPPPFTDHDLQKKVCVIASLDILDNLLEIVQADGCWHEVVQREKDKICPKGIDMYEVDYNRLFLKE